MALIPLLTVEMTDDLPCCASPVQTPEDLLSCPLPQPSEVAPHAGQGST
jgi:hypothetical protein